MERVAAILSDFDGTLCPTSGIKYNYNSSDFIPRSIEDILCEISLTVPIAIITSKDFDFIYPKTRKFAKILSCILGLEMFVLDDRQQINHNKNILNENKKVSTEDIAIKDRISLFDHEMLSINSHMLNEIAAYIEKNYHTMNVEKKFLKDEENLLGGITLDWRHNSNWMVNKEKYKEIVKESVYNILNSAQQKEEAIYPKKNQVFILSIFLSKNILLILSLMFMLPN